MKDKLFIKLTSDSADRIFYLCVLGFGSLSIVFAKYFDYNAIAVSLAVFLILFYAIICMSVATFRLPEERVGDNSYYLGFIFTLVSLAYALWAFDEGRNTNQLVSDFGLALASTIFGIGTRVVIQQFRLDTEEIDRATRESLTEAADQVRAELLNVVEDVQGLSIAYRDKLTELNQELTRDAVETVSQLRADLAHHKALSSSLRQSYNKLGQSHRESTDALVEQLARLAPSVAVHKQNLDTSFESLIQSIGAVRIDAPPNLFDSMRAALESSSLKVQAFSSALGESTTSVRGSMNALSGALADTAEAARQFRLTVPPDLFANVESAINQASKSINEFASRLIATVAQYEQANFEIPETAFEPLRTGLLAVTEELSRVNGELVATERVRLAEMTTQVSTMFETNAQVVNNGLGTLSLQNQALQANGQRIVENTEQLNAHVTNLTNALTELTVALAETNRRIATGAGAFSIFGRRN